MYASEEDPYVYADTDTLINSAGIKDAKALSAFEAEMFKLRSREGLPKGNFDSRHYRNIHKHLFQDVYDWAGTYRTLRIAKGGNWFCYPEYIESHMDKVFMALEGDKFLRGLSSEKFARHAASLLSDLNAIHPFRDGNGRTQLLFLGALSKAAGHPLNINEVNPELFLKAMIKSFNGHLRPLETEIEIMLT